jgi:hypothetical protein
MARTISSMQATALRAALQRRASICAMSVPFLLRTITTITPAVSAC